jgi:hypothetical protein
MGLVPGGPHQGGRFGGGQVQPRSASNGSGSWLPTGPRWRSGLRTEAGATSGVPEIEPGTSPGADAPDLALSDRTSRAGPPVHPPPQQAFGCPVCYGLQGVQGCPLHFGHGEGALRLNAPVPCWCQLARSVLVSARCPVSWLWKGPAGTHSGPAVVGGGISVSDDERASRARRGVWGECGVFRAGP